TVSWTENNTPPVGQWEGILLPAGSPPPVPTETGIDADSNPFTVNDLEPGTNYVAYVRSVCSDTDSNFWRVVASFDTLGCLAANQCNYTFRMTDSFGGWEGNTMSIIQSGVIVATIGSTFTSGTGPVTVHVPLCNGIPFELFWNTGGNFAFEVGVSITSFLGDVLFTHAPGNNLQGQTLYEGMAECIPPTCLKPTNVAVLGSSVTLDSATVSWTENNTPAATQWEIIVLP